MSKQTIIACDICGFSGAAVAERKQIAVARMTDTNDGCPCVPYLELLYLDLCPKCVKKITERQPLQAFGAQGLDTFKWREPSD
jgi:hypothetical protein